MSYPYLHVAHAFACEYGLVLAYADYLEGRHSYPLMELSKTLPRSVKAAVEQAFDTELKRRKTVNRWA